MVGEADNGLEAFKMTRKLKPEVIIMDINMPVLNGIDATRLIAEDFPVLKYLAFQSILSANSWTACSMPVRRATS